MTLKSYLWGMRISWLIALTAWLLVFLRIDPEKSGAPGLLLFYISAFLLFASSFILMLTWIWRKFQAEDDLSMAYVSVCFRQGVLLSSLVIILLLFQQHRVLTWWDGSLSVAGIFLIELFFLTRK